MRWVNAVYWLVLCAWVSAVIAAGVSAMGVFSKLPHLGVHVKGYEAYLGDDTQAHGRLAGGKIMEPIFAATDVAQIACAGLALVCLAIQWRGGAGRGWGNRVRVFCVVGAAAIVGAHVAFLGPPMNRALRGFWSAAQRNDASEAKRLQAEFDVMHHRADRLYTLRLALLIVAIPASALTLGPGTKESGDGAT